VHVFMTGSFQIILILLQQWLASPALSPGTRSRNRRPSTLTSMLSLDGLSSDPPIRRQSYQVINSKYHGARFAAVLILLRFATCHS
jgi:hypothetical protein